MKVKGSTLMGGLLVFTAVFSGALWYAQTYAYYEVTEPEEYPISLTQKDGETEQIAARDFTILDADTSPLKIRICFTVEASLAELSETYQTYPAATPLKQPGWFDCFDYQRLTEDIKSGLAVAFLGQRDIFDGVDRVIAVYDDGRAYAWQQLNEKYAGQ